MTLAFSLTGRILSLSLVPHGESTMSRQREPMKRIKEVLRLSALQQLSERDIVRATQMKRSTVQDYLRRAQEAQLTWAQARVMDDAAVMHALFPPQDGKATTRPQPDWDQIHTELRRKHVTLLLLWEEYRSEHPDGYGYSRFCELYGRHRATLDLSMR